MPTRLLTFHSNSVSHVAFLKMISNTLIILPGDKYNKENLLHPTAASAARSTTTSTTMLKTPIRAEEAGRRHTMAASPLANRNKRK